MNVVKHYLTLFFCQWIPALLIDFLMLIFFQPRFMIRVQKKIYIGLAVLQFFTTRRWDFRSDNFRSIYDKLSTEEQRIFNMNTEEVEEKEYLKNCILGGRQYCLKEPLTSLPKARIQLKLWVTKNNCQIQTTDFTFSYRQRFFDVLLKFFWVYIFGKWFLNWTGLAETLNEIFINHQSTNSS